MPERVLVIGARRRRQGIGAYVAREFHAAGCEVCAVVGTSEASAGEARDQLSKLGVHATAYTDLRTALRQEKPDIVAVCSPYDVHRSQLPLIAEAGAHCLCEKPFWWEPSVDREADTARLVDAFQTAGRYLDLLTQWPRTLPTYFELYPGARDRPVERFEMRMSPIAPGAGMVLDSAPHVISMLWAVAGAGKILSPTVLSTDDRRTLTLDFEYRTARGSVAATCRFVTCEQQPRPTWYGINGLIAERRVEMPSYQMRFEAQNTGRSVPLPDPLALHVRAFIENTRRQPAIERQRMIESVTNLASLYEAARDTEAAPRKA